MANIFVEAKKLQKTDPRMKWQDAVKKAGKSISGIKKKKPVKRVVVSSKTVIKKKAIGAKPAVKRTVSIGGLNGAMAIARNIEKLELKRKNAKTKIEKDTIQVFINKEHDKLDRIKKQ